MYLIQSIIRPEKITEVTDALAEIGVYGMTKFPVIGRGNQSGLKVGDMIYKDIPKEMIQPSWMTIRKLLLLEPSWRRLEQGTATMAMVECSYFR